MSFSTVFLRIYSNYLFYSHVSNLAIWLMLGVSSSRCKLSPFVMCIRQIVSHRTRKTPFHPTEQILRIANRIFQFWTMWNKSFLHLILSMNMNWTLRLQACCCLRMNCYYFIYSMFRNILGFFIIIAQPVPSTSLRLDFGFEVQFLAELYLQNISPNFDFGTFPNQYRMKTIHEFTFVRAKHYS